MTKTLLTTALLVLSLSVSAQSLTDSTDTRSLAEKYKEFKKGSRKQYTDFREEANRQYALFIEKAWEQYTMGEPEPMPKNEELVVPPVCDDDSLETAAGYCSEVISIYPMSVPKPQPMPISAIQPFDWQNQGIVAFDYYGTPCEVRFDEKQKFALPTLDKPDIANAWRVMANARYNNTISDCLKIRDSKNLNDWAYLQMLQQFSEAALGQGNEARLLTAFLYTQSGYKTRILKTLDTPEPKISLLYGTEYLIYGKPALKSGNIFFYPVDGDISTFEYVDYPFPKEQPMSLTIDKAPVLKANLSESRHIQSVRYPHIEADVAVDQNLICFYNDYPTWRESDNFMSKWAFYANTPLDPEVKRQLYPQLKAKLDSNDQNKALEQLLNLVQSCIPYVYDDVAWGYDRAFFSEETLFYAGADCEDHAILFSRLVRDLLGMEVVLVYYPGHLATAVYMGDDYRGDKVIVDGKRFTICDPTYPGARAGRSMPNVDKTRIQAIKLD